MGIIVITDEQLLLIRAIRSSYAATHVRWCEISKRKRGRDRIIQISDKKLLWRLPLLMAILLLQGNPSNAYISVTTTTRTFDSLQRRRVQLHVPRQPHPSSSLFAFDPNEEIWPPTNQDTPIRLEDSFIGGTIPAKAAIPRQRRFPVVGGAQVLAVVLIILYTLPHIQPVDALLVLLLTGYVVVAAQWSKTEDSGVDPTWMTIMDNPMIQRPLGPRLSSLYDTWLTVGGYLGLVLPVLLLMLLLTGSTTTTSATVVARPIFVYACQVLTQQQVQSLPLRAWVTAVYAVIRLAYVYTWWGTTVMTTNTSSPLLVQQVLATVTLVYTLVHVVVVVPMVVMRSLRVHFFLVEAAAVELRPGCTSIHSIGSMEQPSD